MKRGTLIIILILVVLAVSYTITRCSEAQISQYGRSKAEPIMSPPVMLPTELFKCKIEQMRVGDIGYCGATSMIVDIEGRAYLWGFTELEKDKSLDGGWLRIERKIDGYYVSLKLGKQKWANGETYYWSPYTIKTTFHPAEVIIDLKKKAESTSIFPVKKILLYRDRGFWFKKDQLEIYEERLPKEVCKNGETR